MVILDGFSYSSAFDSSSQTMIVKAKQIHAERIKTSRKPSSIDSEIEQVSKRINKEKERYVVLHVKK